MEICCNNKKGEARGNHATGSEEGPPISFGDLTHIS